MRKLIDLLEKNGWQRCNTGMYISPDRGYKNRMGIDPENGDYYANGYHFKTLAQTRFKLLSDIIEKEAQSAGLALLDGEAL
jgi:hypothetical protein